MRGCALLACVVAMSACSRLDLPWERVGADAPLPEGWPESSPTSTPVPGPLPASRLWHSWDAKLLDGVTTMHASVLDTHGSLVAELVLYHSTNPEIEVARFDEFHEAASHPDLADELGVWRAPVGLTAPYGGKSATPRASPAPSPLGVFDLQLHPPTGSGNFATVAFVAPTSGTYSVAPVSFHRIRTDGDATFLRVYDENGNQVDSYSTVGPDWVTGGAITLGVLDAGDRVYFSAGPGPGGDNLGDALELSFSIRRDP